MEIDVYAALKQGVLALAGDGLYWLLLVGVLLLWIRTRRAAGNRRGGMSLIALLGMTAGALVVLSMPAGPRLGAWLLTPGDLPVLDEGGSVAAEGPIVVAVFSGGIARYSPAGAVDAVWQPKPVSLRRVLRGRAVALAHDLPLAISGGRVPPEAPPEAAVIARSLGLYDDPRVLLETRSRDTCENARGLARLAAVHGWAGAVVATDGVHLRRAAACLRAAGLPPVAVAPAEPPARWRVGDFLPRPSGLAGWRPVLREAIGIAYYLARGRFAPSDL